MSPATMGESAREISPSRDDPEAPTANTRVAIGRPRERGRSENLRRLGKRYLQVLREEYPPEINAAHPRPTTRRECEPRPQPCPWCGETVVLRMVPDEPNVRAADRRSGRREQQDGESPVGDCDGAGDEPAIVVCPHCQRRVSYRDGVGGTDGQWARYDPRANPPGLDSGSRSRYNRALNGCRPCQFAGCKYHLATDEGQVGKSIKRNLPSRDVDEIAETCALDVADDGGRTLEEIGELIGITRERIRQIESRALAKLRAANPGLYQALVER